MTGNADLLRLGETPPWILHLPGQRLRGHVVICGGAGAGPGQAGMHRDQFMVAIDAHGDRRGLEPQGLPQQAEGNGVQAFLELHMGIAMDLDLGPGRRLRWMVW